jgi:hypothetical protein
MTRKFGNYVVKVGSLIHVGGLHGLTKKEAQKLRKELGKGRVMTRRKALFAKD